jgi:hypothetical protein
MAEKKISELPIIETPSASALIPIVVDGNGVANTNAISASSLGGYIAGIVTGRTNTFTNTNTYLGTQIFNANIQTNSEIENVSTGIRVFNSLQSINNYTGSDSGVINKILQTTASLNIQTGSQDSVNLGISTFSGSIRSEVSGIEAYTASLKAVAIVSSSNQILNYNIVATTGSNTFYGDQTISGSLFISGATEFGGDLVPKTARGATLGTLEKPFREIYVQSGSINIASDTPGDPNTSLSNEGGNILVSAGGMRLVESGNSFIAETGSFQFISGSMTQVGDYTQTGDYVMVGDKTITGSLNVMGNINVASGSGFFYEGNKLFNRGQFYHTETLSGSADTAFPFQYNTTDTSVTNGTVYVDEDSKIYVVHTGVYNIQFSAQLRATTNDPIEFSVWFSMTGSNIMDSNTDYSIAKVGGGGNMVAALNYLMPLSSGSYFEIYYSKTRTDGQIEAKGTQSTPTRPATPSVILTVTQIA